METEKQNLAGIIPAVCTVTAMMFEAARVRRVDGQEVPDYPQPFKLLADAEQYVADTPVSIDGTRPWIRDATTSRIADSFLMVGGRWLQSEPPGDVKRTPAQAGESTFCESNRDVKASGATDYCNQVCGGGQCGAERVCQYGIDPETHLPATAESDRKLSGRINPARDLPFMTACAGHVPIHSADGRSVLSNDWTGLCVDGSDVSMFWHIGRDNGERSYTALQAKTYDAAAQESESKKCCPL